jgi:transcriptional regulator with XRE-family HTH domain
MILIINLGLCCGNLGVSKKVGDRIRKYRQLAGYNQEYVAEEIGMSGGNFGKIERGEIDINTEYLYKLARLFKVPVSEFFEEKAISIVSEKNVPYGYATKADLESLAELVKKLASEVEKLREAIPATKPSGKKKKN